MESKGVGVGSARDQGPVSDGTLLREGRLLEYLTIAWNLVEAVVSIWAGILAGSTALVGFGVDSTIESASGAVLLWRLQDRSEHGDREGLALRLVGVSFLLLAAWVGFEASQSLWTREPTATSLPGIVIAALSLVVMPWLALGKRRVAEGLRSRALRSDSRQTTLCAYLSAILLTGLLLNALFGWWWADHVAALAMLPIILGEARSALRGERCEC